ncbi:MAG: hypothetical protein UX28_C0003G0106 [Candidatus Pacebacteria bacterium GW2011_GWA1_46_10]|nr:MAG: hypothetical protein UX28_C0003G0106 [Candidatus Pacebacteria bacterium GW2011_GWA1_46_10]HCR81625.1 hypothetical protein [Candidatus Paceibacterota bacterium]
MTDTSLPNHQSSAQNSYVDSYSPPASGSVKPVGGSSTPPQPAGSVPTSSTTSDPLAELEKALSEYEARQKQNQAKHQAVVKQAGTIPSTDLKEDPLAELERVLDEYDRKYRQKPGAQSTTTRSTSVQSAAPAQSTPQPKDDDKTMTADEFKYMLKHPNSPANTMPVAQPVAGSSTSSDAGKDFPAADKEAIEEQNIFELLGVMKADEHEKEAFLDELQQALWEDFLDKDLALLIDDNQLKEIQALRKKTDLTDTARQEQLIQKVEQLVPDIEEIMLEKALELKEDMVKERLAGMKEYYATKPDEMTKIQQAEQHILHGRWKTGAQLLNTLTT